MRLCRAVVGGNSDHLPHVPCLSNSGAIVCDSKSRCLVYLVHVFRWCCFCCIVLAQSVSFQVDFLSVSGVSGHFCVFVTVPFAWTLLVYAADKASAALCVSLTSSLSTGVYVTLWVVQFVWGFFVVVYNACARLQRDLTREMGVYIYAILGALKAFSWFPFRRVFKSNNALLQERFEVPHDALRLPSTTAKHGRRDLFRGTQGQRHIVTTCYLRNCVLVVYVKCWTTQLV